MKTHQTDFSSGNVYRNIMEVAVPMIIAQILNLLYNIVDRIYIGRIPEIGATALTGVGLCFPIITLITAFTYLFGNGGAPLCSMERGRGNDKEAEMLMGNTFVMLVGTGAVLTVTGLLFYRPILYAFGASDVTFPYASSYIKIYLLGTLFVMITLGMNPFINSQGFGNMGMLTILIGAVLNIVLDPLFIFVFHMGVRGAAVATIISQFCCVGFTISLWKKGSADFEKKCDGNFVEACRKHCRPWHVRLFYGIYKQPGASCMQCHTSELGRRYLCWCYDCFKFS